MKNSEKVAHTYIDGDEERGLDGKHIGRKTEQKNADDNILSRQYFLPRGRRNRHFVGESVN